MAIYVSTACLLHSGNNIFGVLEAYAGACLKNVELGSTSEKVAGLSLARFKQYGFSYICHHLFPPPPEPFIVNLASQDPVILKRSMEQMKRSIDFCHSLGIELFSFHSGFRSDPDIEFNFLRDKAVASYEIAFDTYVASVKEVNSYAQNKGVKIAIENNVLSDYNVINGENPYLLTCRAEEFEELFVRIPSVNVGVLLDLGHLKSTSHWLGFDRYDFIERVKDRVLAIHVHDNNGYLDEHKMLDEESWCFEIINRERFKGLPVALESFGLTIEQVVQQVGLIERALGESQS